jgi:Cft2 family RNA processing exonuclease
MDITFLGGATTVTGSTHLITTDRARVLVDCGMFQGSPNESIRNRVPFGFDPATLDAVLLTHAHLDHCGRLPLLVKEGYDRTILATAGTCELASLVLLDSGTSTRSSPNARRAGSAATPDRGRRGRCQQEAAYQAAVDLASDGRLGGGDGRDARAPRPRAAAADRGDLLCATGEHVATTVEPRAARTTGRRGTRRPSCAASRPSSRSISDAPLYTVDDAQEAIAHLRPIDYDEEREVAPGVWATFLDAGHILGSAIIRLRVQDAGGRSVIVCSGDLGRPDTPIIRDPTYLDLGRLRAHRVDVRRPRARAAG